jgi:ABC-type Fe3+/spermidine/putrescine transport system ATPase subunit
VSVSLRQGERLYACGDSAPGLLLAIAGFEPVDAGRIVCEGRDMTGVAAPDRHLAFIPPGDSLIPGRSLRANLTLPGTARAHADAALERLGLAELAAHPAARLSPAQRRLGALARALATNPALLLVEEGAADPPAIPDILASLSRPCAIIAGAAPPVALARADRILLLRAGNTAQLGTPRDIHERPADADAALWSGPCNLIPARLDGPGERPGSVRARIGPYDMTARYRDATEGAVALAIRPTRLRLEPGGLPATVRAVDYEGATTRLTLVVAETGRGEGGATLRLDLADAPALAPGEAVAVGWDWQQAWPVPPP